MRYERDTANLLRRLGVNNSYKGFNYTAFGVSRAIQDPELLTYISKGLYAEIACRFQTTTECVERNIRTVIKTIWEHGDRKLMNEMFEKELKQKPCNVAFLDAVAHYIGEHHCN